MLKVIIFYKANVYYLAFFQGLRIHTPKAGWFPSWLFYLWLSFQN